MFRINKETDLLVGMCSMRHHQFSSFSRKITVSLRKPYVGFGNTASIEQARLKACRTWFSRTVNIHL